MNDKQEKITMSAPNRVELKGIDRYSAFEVMFSDELVAIQQDIVAYQHAFGEELIALPVRVDVWKLGAPEVHIGGHSAKVWVEDRKDLYGRPQEVLVIQNGYNPRPDISQTTTFELSMATARNEDHAVAMRMTHKTAKDKPYEMKTLLPGVTPDRFRQMLDMVKSSTPK